MEVVDATSGVVHVKKIDLSTIMNSCRICMARNVNMTSIFGPNSENIIEEILYCTGVCIKKEDGLPSKICITCLTNLSIAFKFKTSCTLADETFRKLIVEEIKEEGIKTESIKDEEQETDVEYETVIEYDIVDSEGEIKDVEVKLDTTEELQTIPKKTNKCIPEPTKRGRPKAGSKRTIRLKKFKFKKLYCEACDIKFDNKQQCDEHKKAKHKDSDTWVCEICGKLFLHRASHYTHIKSHLPPKYACEQCDYKTWHKYDLVKHIRIHTGVKMYQCEYCTSSYYTSSNLTGHIRRNHMKERPFECHLCRSTFFDRTKLNRHIDSHNEIKRFECEVCHACFTRRCYWKKHLLRQHDIVTPPQRPGRQKVNALVGEHLINKQITQLVNNDKQQHV
ncbi:uncharacterized protein LOC142985292 isoform X2 [Anticarsia gemmatalis]|uniref:uncharacterized protein LOC142985292 isoform X2 n=1 Tax=Anticarsia gemmatalis TaxID=129554 RepID=UPI003F76ACD9